MNIKTVWTVLGDKRFFSVRPILDSPVYKEKLSVNDFYSWELIELSAIYPDAKIINDPGTYNEKIFCAGGMFFRTKDKEKWERSLSRVKFEEVWNPQELSKKPHKIRREYSFPVLPPDSPFVWNRLAISVNLPYACKYMGLR